MCFLLHTHTQSRNLEDVHGDVFLHLVHNHVVQFHGDEGIQQDSSFHVDHAKNKPNHNNELHTRSSIKQSLTYTSRLRFEKSIKSRIKTQFSKKIAAQKCDIVDYIVFASFIERLVCTIKRTSNLIFRRPSVLWSCCIAWAWSSIVHI